MAERRPCAWQHAPLINYRAAVSWGDAARSQHPRGPDHTAGGWCFPGEDGIPLAGVLFSNFQRLHFQSWPVSTLRLPVPQTTSPVLLGFPSPAPATRLAVETNAQPASSTCRPPQEPAREGSPMPGPSGGAPQAPLCAAHVQVTRKPLSLSRGGLGWPNSRTMSLSVLYQPWATRAACAPTQLRPTKSQEVAAF